MKEGIYLICKFLFSCLPFLLSMWREDIDRGGGGGGGSGDKYIFLFVNYNLEFGTNWKYTIYKIATQVDPVQSS